MRTVIRTAKRKAGDYNERFKGFVEEHDYVTSAILILSGVVLAVGSYYFSRTIQNPSVSYAFAFFISLLSGASLFFPVASWASIIGMAPNLNPITLSFCAALGSSLGEFSGYFLGNGTSRIVKKKFKKYHVAYTDALKKYGLIVLFLLAFIPNPLFDVAGILSGAIGMPLLSFFIPVFLGRFCRYLLMIFGVRLIL